MSINAIRKYSAAFTLDGSRIKIAMEVRASERPQRSAEDPREMIPAGNISFAFSGDCASSSGQCCDGIREIYDESSCLDDEMDSLVALLDAWDEFHLSSTQAGTNKQAAWLAANAPKAKSYDEVKAALAGTEMEIDRGYSYGSAWLARVIDPAEEAAIAEALAALDGKDLGTAPDLSALEDLDGDAIDSRNVITNVEIYRGWARAKGYDLSIGLDDPNSPEIPDDDVETFEAARRVVSLDEEGRSSAGDWDYGATMIRDSYFETYAEEFAKDIGAIDSNASWPLRHIDWEAAADSLKQDYTEISFGDAVYWVR